jgi:hypothetical protein
MVSPVPGGQVSDSALPTVTGPRSCPGAVEYKPPRICNFTESVKVVVAVPDCAPVAVAV